MVTNEIYIFYNTRIVLNDYNITDIAYNARLYIKTHHNALIGELEENCGYWFRKSRSSCNTKVFCCNELTCDFSDSIVSSNSYENKNIIKYKYEGLGLCCF